MAQDEVQDCEAVAQALREKLDKLLCPSPDQPSPHERMARIVRTIESDIIPRLVRAHRLGGEAGDSTEASPLPEVGPFTQLLLGEDDGPSRLVVDTCLAQGMPLDDLCLKLFAPAANELGRLWDDDRCSFSDVTVGMGRLQRLLHMVGPLLGETLEPLPDSRRALLMPAPGDPHTFGLSIVAEFFRRAGWDVVCPSGATSDMASLARAEWFDVVGISVAMDARVDWLRSGVAAVRQASRNRSVAVMVGGPMFIAFPERAAEVGADGTVADARQAPLLAGQLVDARAVPAAVRAAGGR
jgi:methanogenic corrinoid protein MtbC1